MKYRIGTFYDHVKEISQQEKLPLIEALKLTKELGVDSLEISQNNVIGREDELGNELACAGLAISSIPAYFNFGRDADVDTQSEPTLEAARFLGAKKLLVIPGFLNEQDSPEEKERQTRGMIDGVSRLADKAARYGVSLVMEDYDSTLAPFSTYQGMNRFLAGCPQLSACFDTGNFRFMAQDELEAYEALRGRIAHVHLKDRAYGKPDGEGALLAADGQGLLPSPVGAGKIRIGEILSRLDRDGYEGDLVIEHYGAPQMLRYLQSSVEWIRAQLG